MKPNMDYLLQKYKRNGSVAKLNSNNSYICAVKYKGQFATILSVNKTMGHACVGKMLLPAILRW